VNARSPPALPSCNPHNITQPTQLFGGGAGAGGSSSNSSNSSSNKRASRRPSTATAAAAAAAALAAVAAVAARRASRRRGGSRRSLPTARMHGGGSGSQEAGAAGASTAVAEREAAQPTTATATTTTLRLAIDPCFEGTWIKLKDKSSSMEEALDAFHMSGLPRRAAGLVRGVAVHLHPKGGAKAGSAAATPKKKDDDGDDNEPEEETQAIAETEFEFAVFSALPLLKVRERYTIDGPPGKARRRDLRRGQHSARAVSLEGGKAMRLEIEWPDPFGGKGFDDFRINESGELVISSELTMNNGERVAFVAVHRRK
jgi:hypothetical protein